MRFVLPIIAVAVGGAGGAVARHLIAEAIRLATPLPAYVATMLANVVGCFAIGIVFVHLEDAGHAPWVRPLVVTGLLGAFTTFSTFSLDAMHLIDDRRLVELAAYIAGSVLLGLAAVKLGMMVSAAVSA